MKHHPVDEGEKEALTCDFEALKDILGEITPTEEKSVPATHHPGPRLSYILGRPADAVQGE